MKKTILIVDDSPDNLTVMKQVIAKALPDVTILTCQHPEKVMPLLGDTHASLALLDVQMPGMDGFELCRRIKSNADTQSVSVILITSHGAEPKMKARGMELGADDFIMRPIDNAEFNARVKVALRVHRSEATLRYTASDARRRFETIVRCSPDMMAMLDRDYVYLAANDAYASAFGKALDDIEGQSVAQVFGEEFFEAVIRPHAERCLTGEEVRYSDWFDFPVTGRHFMDVSYSPYRGGNGKIEGFVVNARDFTERKLTEGKLIASETKSRAWLSNSPVCTKILDLDFNLQYMSSSGVKDLKIDDITQYYGKPYPMPFYPDSFKVPMALNLKKAKDTGETITQEAFVVDIEGNKLWYHSTIVPVKSDDGQIEYIMVISLEITERKRAEASQEEALAALYLERQRLDYVIEGSRLGTWAWNIKENSALFNEMWATLLGYTMDEVGPSSYELWKSLGHPDDVPQIEDLLQQCATGEMLDYSSEFRMRHKDGHWVWILDRGRVMTHDAEGRPLEMFGTHTDITELKIVEAELEKQREHLEERVQERTEKLRKTINLMAGRENRMAELKMTVKKLRSQLEEAGMTPMASDPLQRGSGIDQRQASMEAEDEAPA